VGIVTVGQPVTRLPPAQIPACGTSALGSSEILASVKDKLILPSLLFPAVQSSLSFHRVDLPFDKELMGSLKFFISLHRHTMCRDHDRPS